MRDSWFDNAPNNTSSIDSSATNTNSTSSSDEGDDVGVDGLALVCDIGEFLPKN